MENYIGLQDVANILTFIAPGYFAIKAYDVINARSAGDFSHLLIASVVISLPLVGAYTYLWSLFGYNIETLTDAKHAPLLVLFSVIIGFIAARLRSLKIVQQVAGTLQLPHPDNDFLRVQFHKLDKADQVVMKLKNGEMVTGTPQGGSRFGINGSRQYYFNNIAWFDKQRKQWDPRPGSVIIDLAGVEYIETLKSLPKG